MGRRFNEIRPGKGIRAVVVLAVLTVASVWDARADEADTTVEPFGPEWSVVENQPCQVWNSGLNKTALAWFGPCFDGKASGIGLLVHGDSTYQGAMLAGKKHGYGITTSLGGIRFEGQWRDGKRDGQGTLTHRDGTRFVGIWRNGERNGIGTYIYSDNSVHPGLVSTCKWRDGEVSLENCTRRFSR